MPHPAFPWASHLALKVIGLVEHLAAKPTPFTTPDDDAALMTEADNVILHS